MDIRVSAVFPSLRQRAAFSGPSDGKRRPSVDALVFLGRSSHALSGHIPIGTTACARTFCGQRARRGPGHSPPVTPATLGTPRPRGSPIFLVEETTLACAWCAWVRARRVGERRLWEASTADMPPTGACRAHRRPCRPPEYGKAANAPSFDSTRPKECNIPASQAERMQHGRTANWQCHRESL